MSANDPMEADKREGEREGTVVRKGTSGTGLHEKKREMNMRLKNRS